MDWKKEKFKTLMQHKSGYTWSKEQETKIPEPNTVRVLTVTNIQKELDLSSKLYLKDVSDIDKIKKAVSKEWSIAVSSNGNRKRIGNAVYIKENSEYLFASFLTAFKPKEDVDILPEYFFRWLNSHKIQERITSVSEGTTGLGNLDIRYLRNMEIEYPKNPKEQTAIATILSKVDEAIEATRQSIKSAEKLKKTLMQNLLTGKLKPDGTYRADDEFYEDEKFGKVPVGWEYDKVKNLTNRVTDGEHLSPDFQDSGSYLLSAEDVNDDGISFFKAKFVNPIDCNKFRKRCNPDFGDVLIVSRGAGIGRTCRITVKDNFCLMGSVILIKPNNEKLYGGFLAQYFKSYKAWVELQRLSGTTAQQAIYLTHIKKVKLSYPKDLNEQELISTKLESFDKNIANKQTKIKTLQRLKKSLMQNLLIGKVRVDVEAINKIINEKSNG